MTSLNYWEEPSTLRESRLSKIAIGLFFYFFLMLRRMILRFLVFVCGTTLCPFYQIRGDKTQHTQDEDEESYGFRKLSRRSLRILMRDFLLPLVTCLPRRRDGSGTWETGPGETAEDSRLRPGKTGEVVSAFQFPPEVLCEGTGNEHREVRLRGVGWRVPRGKP